MPHPICSITAFSVVEPYTLLVAFADGTEQRIDFKPEADTLVWPNGADFDPATLHDWPQVSEELGARAQQWSATWSHKC